MKRDLYATLVIMILILITTLGGCSPASDAVSISPAPPSLTSTVSTLDSATPTPTSTIVDENTPLATSTSTPIITPTLVATATPMVVSDHPISRICTNASQVFDIGKTLGIYNYAHLSFQGEDTILFDGWAHRPEPHNAQDNAAQITPGPDPLGGISSARVILRAGQIDLESSQILSRTLDMALPLDNLAAILGLPTDEPWPLEQVSDRVDVLGQSPDEQWQLVQISDWSRDAIGIWLISQTETLQVVPYVPSSSTWEWADDSSILWYVHNTPEFGADSVIVYLEDPPRINRSQRDPENPLDATYYRLAFSPVEKTVLSTGDPSELGSDTDELIVIDATDTNLQSSQTIPDITMAVWNQATQSYILKIQTDNSTNFVDLSGTLAVQAPWVMPPDVFALSPSGQRLAFGYGSAGIWVYECSN